MSNRRSSDPNAFGAVQHAAFRIDACWRTAGKLGAQEAQRKIDERHAKQAVPKPHTLRAKKSSQYSPELVAEALMIVEAGWSVASTARLFDVPYSTLLNWTMGINRHPSAADGKRGR